MALSNPPVNEPLAERMRPRNLAEVLGQEALTGPGSPLRAAGPGSLPSLIFWGPPGSGKTTLARLYAGEVGARFIPLSAVLCGVADLREALAAANATRNLERRPTVLFVDEIHRWNKAQQDALLPHVESGAVALVGATTENPSFEVIAPLRSRCRMVRLRRLERADLVALLRRALLDADRGLGSRRLGLDDGVLEAIAAVGDGDARRALGLLEDLARRLPDGGEASKTLLMEILAVQDIHHDKGGDAHYDVFSAFIKSMRGSDPDASVYWMARLLAGGEPPEAIARRVVIFAAEDVGNADPRALGVAVDAMQAVALVGMPEARIPLSMAVTWCASAPKSNAAYLAVDEALARVKETGALPVPLHLRNAVSEIMRSEGYGQGYLYPHDFPGHVVRQSYRPPEVASDRYYRPTVMGAEKSIAERLAYWSELLDKRP